MTNLAPALLTIATLAAGCSSRASVAQSSAERPHAQASQSSKAAIDGALGGVVLDDAHNPIAGVEVLLCARPAACSFVRQHALASSQSLQAVVAELPKWISESTTLTTTDSAGRWRAVQHTREPGEVIVGLFASPGRELGYAGASASEATRIFAEVTLRPAIAIDLDLQCGESPCRAIMTTIGAGDRFPNATHIERLPRGVYEFSIFSGFGQPGERRGRARVDTSSAQDAIVVEIPMSQVGTGQPIQGTAAVHKDDDTLVAKLVVAATCGAERVARRAQTDASGAFELKDVGPPPCELTIATDFGEDYEPLFGTYRVIVDRVPAMDVRLEARAARRPVH
jgi:hypothetical protein